MTLRFVANVLVIGFKPLSRIFALYLQLACMFIAAIWAQIEYINLCFNDDRLYIS